MKSEPEMFTDIAAHYDALIDEGNDPVYDPPPLQDYMDQWDGQAFIDRLALSPEKSVLEIGVGTGRLARRVAPLCGTFCGIDLSPKTVWQGRVNLADFPSVTLIEGDFYLHSFDRQFDVVYSSLTFMHLSDKQAAIQKVALLLKPGGRFVLSITKDSADRLDYGGRQVRLYPSTPETIMLCARNAGLDVIECFERPNAFGFVCIRPQKSAQSKGENA